MKPSSNSAISASPQRLLSSLHWLLMGSILFFYAWLNYRRYFPPFVLTIQLVVVLVLCLWVGWKVVKRQRLSRSPLNWPLLALLASSTLSTFFSIDFRRSFDGLLATLALVLFFFLFCDMLLAGWNPRLFLSLMLWMATLSLGLGLWIAAGAYWEWWQAASAADYPPMLLSYRLYGVTDHPNFLAASLNLALPFAIIRMATARSVARRAVWASWLLAYVLVLFLTHSRGGWLVATGVVGITVVGLMIQHGFPRPSSLFTWLRQTWRLWGVTLLYVALFLLLMFAPDLSQLFSTPSEQTLTQSQFTTNAGRSLKSAPRHRFDLWEVAWHMFQEQPVLGTGPMTYGHAFVREHIAVRFWVPGYAHNLFFEMLGTQGLVGILCLFWLLVTGLFVLLRGWWRWRAKLLRPFAAATDGFTEQQFLLLGACAALAGYFVHSLVDVPGKVLTNDVLLVLITAIGLHAVGLLRIDDQRRLSRWSAGVLLLPLLMVFVLSRHNDGREAMLNAILAALQDDWQSAARNVDDAIAADPNLPFYYGQRGYAYSVLADPVAADIDKQALREALVSYKVALRMEPPYVPHLLNATLLLAQQGNIAEAERLLGIAHDLPQSRFWVLTYLLLADLRADQGNIIAANDLYETAFRYEPHARNMAACQGSASCKRAAERIDEGLSNVWLIHTEARALLSQNQPEQALEVLAAIPLSNANPLPWLDRADAHLALAQEDNAAYALQVAETLRSNNQHPETDAQAALSQAALAVMQGNPQEALAVLEEVARPQLSRNGYGYGIYRQVGLPGTLQPNLDLLRRTGDDLAVYQQLARLYEQMERPQDAVWAQKMAAELATMLDTEAQPRDTFEHVFWSLPVPRDGSMRMRPERDGERRDYEYNQQLFVLCTDDSVLLSPN
jgi:tetratricopeptide (TPR) repeat protein